jgi:phospholipase C
MRGLVWLTYALMACGSSQSVDTQSDASSSDVLAETDTIDRDAARLACAFSAGALAGETLGVSPPAALKHLLVLVQENRSFDHVLGRHPRVAKGELDGFPATYVNLDAAGNVHAPARATTHCMSPGPPHGWDDMHAQWNDGKNDGFYRTMAKLAPGEWALMYYEPADIPFYTWLYGDTFATSDRFFASALTQTAPNRRFLYAANSISNDATGGPAAPNIFDALDKAGVDWRIYLGATYENALVAPPAAHARALPQLALDLASGDLPRIAFVNAEYVNSEHPPYDIRAGETYLREVVVGLVKSPAWSSSALIVTYDESGGYFDHVPPPPACPPGPSAAEREFDRYGFRMPFVVVSPFARKGYVSHETHSHTSITRLIELMVGLSAMSARDANSDALLDLFDFGAPLPPPDVAAIPLAGSPACTGAP